MLISQINISRSGDQGTGQITLSELASRQKPGRLTIVLCENERFWSCADSLARSKLSEREEQLPPTGCGANTIVAINAMAGRVSQCLKGQACGLSVNGLPGIQRITHLVAYT